MLIKNTNLRRIVSLLFVLCLLFCLVPTMAFAEEYITKEVEDNPDNLQSLKSGSIWINQEALYSNEENGQIVFNYGYVGNNCGTIGTSAAYPGYPSLDGYDNGHIYNNSGTITINYGKVTNNYGTIGTNGVYDSGEYVGVVSFNKGTIENNNSTVNVNECTVKNNSGTVAYNFDTVVNNSNGTVRYNCGTVYGGTVTYNCGGTVKDGTVEIDCFYLKIDFELVDEYFNNTAPEKSGVVITSDLGYADTRCELWGAKGKPLTLGLDIKPGYEPYISGGTGTIKSLGGNEYEISSAGGNIELDVRPISSVPATADMSNVPPVERSAACLRRNRNPHP